MRLSTTSAAARFFLLAVPLLLGALTLPARAQEYPTHAIRIIVPYAPGGQGDITARLVAEGLRTRLPQTVVVENRPGANGTIGTAQVAQAAPDGHTLLLVVASHVLTKALMPNVTFDPVKSFVPITMTARTPVVMVVSPTLPVKTLAEFVAYARSKPGELVYASAGSGSNVHVFAQWFNQLAKLNMIHVPYKGSAAAHSDLIAGRAHMVFDTLPSVQGHVAQGNLKLVAVGGTTRLPQYPDVPTIAESGYPEFEAASWGVVLAPAGTPKPIVDKLNREIVAVLRSPEVKERFASFGSEVVANSPAEMLTILQAEERRASALVRELGIEIGQ
ncbi:tripartite tricarboxylate transporter substrate binding protein [Rhodoplanes sp. TEM]|uniref:Tripartite tricarboxylate transporter substrate binding protein n=1 Tax=Rhodoplanes tepidamans TaxID=200616 RepID=A0ABT5JG54_RHOTP|nr:MULTISPECIES: tripartite tricarboxylate transporter substrate binding protein [Rhodoplanes]MDC7788284.1 tripartite tricarboxylate transporter substrate binding protein [Rhodoplanes tepidamans]MDC7987096.1 tripartite tricarboxylate transporter substrate binding protein [Rhodoplanes sp. TEM]MDQ0355663.1 tripartite-type tricarboxylate transporter receptor subunit TctC [Rhodoplanes tepidamans]